MGWSPYPYTCLMTDFPLERLDGLLSWAIQLTVPYAVSCRTGAECHWAQTQSKALRTGVIRVRRLSLYSACPGDPRRLYLLLY